MTTTPTLTITDAALHLIHGATYLSMCMVEIMDRIRPVQPDTAEDLLAAVTNKANSVAFHGPGYLRHAAQAWHDASPEQRADAVDAILRQALAAGNMEVAR